VQETVAGWQGQKFTAQNDYVAHEEDANHHRDGYDRHRGSIPEAGNQQEQGQEELTQNIFPPDKINFSPRIDVWVL
jgi:hypothetical protein